MPSTTANPPPISMATITGQCSDWTTRVAVNAPKPANAAWPRVMFPLKPVTPTIETKTTMSAIMIWAYGSVM